MSKGSLFYEITVISIPKSDKNATKKIIGESHFLPSDMKILNKLWNQIQHSIQYHTSSTNKVYLKYKNGTII